MAEGARPRKSSGRARPAWRDLTGIVVVDKPVGVSSNALLQRVRRLFRARKAGHTGSLDPLASGVLPLCFGEATKLSGMLLDARKTYEVTACLGARTATGDLDGDVVARAPVPALDVADFDRRLADFRGDIEQVPPMYSALKHQGRRLYDLARRGETVPRPPRRVTIYELACLDWNPPELTLRVTCSKGTYIRTLAEDIGAAVGSEAHVLRLRRVAAGPFTAGDAHPVEALEEAAALGEEQLIDCLLPPDAGVPDLPAVRLGAEETTRLRHGQPVVTGPAGQAVRAGTVRVYGPGNRFLGLGESDGHGRVAPRRLFRDAAPERRD